MPAHFLNGTEPSADGIWQLCQRALELKAGSKPVRADGLRLAAVFLNPSLRTRTSMEAAAHALGIQAMVLSPGKDAWALEMQDGAVMDGDKAEHVKDAVRVLAEYADLLSVRAFAGLHDVEEDRSDPVLTAFATHSPVPVINMESALWHPLQGLADTATMAHHLGQLQGRRVTLTWAPHPKALPAAVPNQVLLSSALQGMDVTVTHPEGFDLDPRIVAQATALAEAGGGAVKVSNDQHAAMAGAEVVVAKSWSGFAGYGRREAEAEKRATLSDWTVDADTMALTDKAGFMHCLPVRRNVVVSDAVIDSPQSWVIEEAGLRMWTAMALLETLAQGGAW